MGRLETGDTAAFLIDQNWRIVPLNGIAEVGDEALDLRRLQAIALEKDKAQRSRFREEIALPGGQFRVGATEDDRTWRHADQISPSRPNLGTRISA